MGGMEQRRCSYEQVQLDVGEVEGGGGEALLASVP